MGHQSSAAQVTLRLRSNMRMRFDRLRRAKSSLLKASYAVRLGGG
jgi:hypothetical protein